MQKNFYSIFTGLILFIKKYNEMENFKREFTIRDIIVFSRYLRLNLDQVNEIFFDNELVK